MKTLVLAFATLALLGGVVHAKPPVYDAPTGGATKAIQIAPRDQVAIVRAPLAARSLYQDLGGGIFFTRRLTTYPFQTNPDGQLFAVKRGVYRVDYPGRDATLVVR